MERIKHHFCWVKAVRGASSPVENLQSTGTSGEMPVDMATSWAPGPEGGSGPIVVAPNFGTVEPAALVSRPLRPITLFFGTVQPDALTDDSLKALSSGVLSVMTGAAAPNFGTVEPMILSNKSLSPLPAEALSAMAKAAAPFFATVPPLDLSTDALAAIPPGDVADVRSMSLELHYGTVPPRRMSAAPVPALSAATPLLFAGATFAGAWQFEPFEGPEQEGPGFSLVFQPIVGTRQEALAWRESEIGQRWMQGALAVALMSFAAMGEL